MRQLAREAKERPADRAALEQVYLGRRQDNSLGPFFDMNIFDEGKSEIDLELWPAGVAGLPATWRAPLI
jgi:hypothetical protein